MVDPKLPRSVAEKLGAIRTAGQHEFPTGDIDRMLAEIEGRFGIAETNLAPSKNEPCRDR